MFLETAKKQSSVQVVVLELRVGVAEGFLVDLRTTDVKEAAGYGCPITTQTRKEALGKSYEDYTGAWERWCSVDGIEVGGGKRNDEMRLAVKSKRA